MIPLDGFGTSVGGWGGHGWGSGGGQGPTGHEGQGLGYGRSPEGGALSATRPHAVYGGGHGDGWGEGGLWGFGVGLVADPLVDAEPNRNRSN